MDNAHTPLPKTLSLPGGVACKRALLLAEAERWLGVQEHGGNNRGEIVKMFQAWDDKADHVAWCMAFVQYCLKQVDCLYARLGHCGGEAPLLSTPEASPDVSIPPEGLAAKGSCGPGSKHSFSPAPGTQSALRAANASGVALHSPESIEELSGAKAEPLAAPRRGSRSDCIFPTEHVMTAWARTPKIARRERPAPGLIAVWQRFRGEEPTSSGHTGIVVAVPDDETFLTVEGNTVLPSPRGGLGVGAVEGVAKKRRGFPGTRGSLRLRGFLDPYMEL